MQRTLAFLLLAALLASAPAAADTLTIDDTPDGVRLDADDVPVDEVVQALSQKFEFAVKVIRPSDIRLSGSRSGTPVELLNWVLTGHNHAIFVSKVNGSDRVSRVVVYGPSGSAPPPRPRQPDEYGSEAGTIEDIPPDGSDMANPDGEPPATDGSSGDFGGNGLTEPPP